MRPSPTRAIATLAFAAALACAGPAALAQGQGAPSYGVSTGQNLLSLSLSLIEATRAGVVFEAVPDTRFRIVRHMQTRFPCAFLPTSQAFVTVVAPGEGAATGDDAVCFESVDGTDLGYRITRRPGQSLDAAFAAARPAANGWFSGDVHEAQGAPLLASTPYQPNVSLDLPRRQTLLVGEAAQGPAMLRIAVVQLPGDWYVTQNYFSPLLGVEENQLDELAFIGSGLAEAALAIRLSETLSPTRDPALASPR